MSKFLSLNGKEEEKTYFSDRGLFYSFHALQYVQSVIPRFISIPSENTAAQNGREGEVCYCEKRLHQVFVNLSLIISSELENKLPASDAEPQIMAEVLKHAIWTRTLHDADDWITRRRRFPNAELPQATFNEDWKNWDGGNIITVSGWQ